jgi:hypothetical protein
MRLRVIACEVLARELYALAANVEGIVDITMLTQGLHDIGAVPMREKLQAEIDATDATRYDAVALGYALCSNGTEGISAREIPVVLPRAHDCITLLLGSRKRYDEAFQSHPGTYYMTSGWFERDHETMSSPGAGIADKLGMDKSYEEYVAEYGEENAQFIIDQLKGGLRHYDRMLFVSSGLGGEDAARAAARERAEAEGWEFVTTPADLTILRKLLSREWDDDFLVLEPGQTVRPTHDERVVDCLARESVD